MRRLLALGLVAILVFVIGIAIGRRGGSPATDATPGTVTIVATDAETTRARGEGAPRKRGGTATYPRSSEGAVAAAVDYLAALNGRVILNPGVARRTVAAMSTAEAREALGRAYAAAASHLRQQLGVGTVPEPVVVVRAAPVGYRLITYAPDAAVIAVWRVGIVGSGATAEPQQSWRTENVSLAWEAGTWKIDSLRSEPGPTPPLATAPTPSAQLFEAVPAFEELRP